MTIAQARQFYKQDMKKYEVENNLELLGHLAVISKRGFTSDMDIENLQTLINTITYWYEFKYPERYFEFSEGIIDLNYKNNNVLSKMMNIQELLYRLTPKQNSFIACEYHSTTGGIRKIYHEKEEIGYQNMGFIHISGIYIEGTKAQDDIFIHFDTSSGLCEISSTLHKQITNVPIQIEKALGLLRDKYGESIDLSSLENCIYIHECDLELRHKILQMVALKILYSKETIPEHGYKRAKLFIQEFNNEFGLALSTDEIDNIMNFFKQNSSHHDTSIKNKLKIFQKKP